MIADFNRIILWWLTILFLSFPTFLFCLKIFNKFWDKGYIFSKITSLGLVTYLIFILGVFRLVPFTSPSILAIIFILLLANFFYFKSPHRLKEIIALVTENKFKFLFEELLFLVLLIGWSFVRGFAPDIEGLEKFMDWGFVNSMLRARFMPPLDMWFAGEPINYYYFGHLIFALITKISNIPSSFTYSISIATVCALTFTSTFSLASNLVFSQIKNLKTVIVGGFLSAILLTFGGNLHSVYKIGKIIIQNEGRLVLNASAVDKASRSYWYPDATRFIGFDPDIKDKTIHEFPLYSFVVADLHGHMNDIPLVLFFCAFLFSIILGAKNAEEKSSLLNWKLVLIGGLTLSLAFMTNAWDFAVYGLLFAISYFIHRLNLVDFKSAVSSTFLNGLLIIVFWYLFTLPFSLHFIPMAEGIKLSDSHTPFYQLFVLYGGFWLICLPLLLVFFKKVTDYRLQITDYFVLSLILTATILIIIPEIVYIKDIYIYEHRRANTMFKLVYQAFMMYSIASGYVFIRLKSNFIYKFIFILVFIIHLIYPYFAIKSYYGLREYRGLWGLNFLKTQYPDNLIAIDWINQNITGQPVILEASGDSYTTFNQVSVATGLPTVEGWVVHEWLWRGGYDKPGARATDVQKIYETKDKYEALNLLHKYSVKYVFLGSKEREKYPNLNEKIFDDIGAKMIFQSGQTKIYQLP